jgi:5-methylcytosine-specific restriction endonuclease McrA
VIERDGGECQLGLPGCTFVATTADHIVSRSLGGDSDMSNLRAACRSCNSRRGARAA